MECETYGNVTKDGQQDVDEEVRIAAALEEHAEGREEDGEDDLANVGGGEGHVCGLWIEEVVLGRRCVCMCVGRHSCIVALRGLRLVNGEGSVNTGGNPVL